MPSYTIVGLRAGWETTLYDRPVRIEGYGDDGIIVDPASGIQEVGDPLTIGFCAATRF